jgi:recombinational DNA repair protein (RecF pathway)
MNQIVTEAIVLSRTDFGEADRILTLLTPEHGKLRVMAKGVRRLKSKLAGGIELFSVSTITFVKGRGEIGTLVSTRLVKYHNHIVKDLDRTMLGYELIKQLNKATEDEPEAAYFVLLRHAFEALDDSDVSLLLIRFWFQAQLLRLSGHTPNLHTDPDGKKLQIGQKYDFDYDRMCFFVPSGEGRFDVDSIKFLRLAFAGHAPGALQQVKGFAPLLELCNPLVDTLVRTQAH